MKEINVKIFTEGGSSMGLGHLSRCSSLYDELVNRGIKVELIVYGDLDSSNFLQGKSILNINWLSGNYLDSYIDSTDYCIVDSYKASKELYQVISGKSKRALFIDDNVRVEYPEGIIVNPSLNCDNLIYPIDEKKLYLLGQKYIILRRPFLNVKRNSIGERVKKVLITMGGSDVRNLTPRILNTFCRKHPEIKFTVIIGNSFNNREAIKDIKFDNIRIYHNADAELMKKLMLRSDLALTAAGQTIYELLATQTPFIAIKIADNQNNNINGLKKINPMQIIIEYGRDDFNETLQKGFTEMLKLEKRKEFFDCYLNGVDGLGSKRIIDRLISDAGDGFNV